MHRAIPPLAHMSSWWGTYLSVGITLPLEFVVFWVVVLCSMVVGDQYFSGLCCLHLLQPEDRSII